MAENEDELVRKVKQLIKALDSEDGRKVAVAAKALGMIGDPSATEALLRVFDPWKEKRGGAPTVVVAAALLRLGKPAAQLLVTKVQRHVTSVDDDEAKLAATALFPAVRDNLRHIDSDVLRELSLIQDVSRVRMRRAGFDPSTDEILYAEDPEMISFSNVRQVASRELARRGLKA